MNVVHLLNDFGDSSISRIVAALVRHLGQREYRFHIGVLNDVGDMRREFSRLGAETVDFSDGKRGMLAASKRIRRYVSEHRINIIHTHTPRTILVAAMALGTAHKPAHLATKHILNIPGDRRWGLLYSLADRILLYAPTHLVAVSGKVHDQITACPWLGGGRVSMIRNAIDSEACHAPGQRDLSRSEFGFAPDLVVIGSSGRLEKVKRYDLLLQAFATVFERFPKVRLMIAGDGSLRAGLATLAGQLGIADAVIWTGFRTDIPRLLAAMDIYVQSSVNEGLSLSILEAMAAGKPVIITDVGGARELVEDGKTGVLIPPGSSGAIAASLLELIENPAKMSKIAQNGRDYVVHEFGLERMMESYGRRYATIASRLP